MHLAEILTAADALQIYLLQRRNPKFTLEDYYAQIAATMLGDINFINLLGSGSYGKVYHAVWQGSHVAVKVIEHVSALVIEMAEREARLSTDLAHPNIVMTLHYAMRDASGQIVTSASPPDANASKHSTVRPPTRERGCSRAMQFCTAWAFCSCTAFAGRHMNPA